MEVTDKFKSDLRSVLLVEKFGVDIKNLNAEYREITGSNLIYNRLKYPTLEQFLATIPDTCSLININGQTIVRAVFKDEKLKDLHQLIRSTPTTSAGRKSRFNSNSYYSGRYNGGYSNRISYDYSINTTTDREGNENNAAPRRRRPLPDQNQANHQLTAINENRVGKINNDENRKSPMIQSKSNNWSSDDSNECDKPIKENNNKNTETKSSYQSTTKSGDDKIIKSSFSLGAKVFDVRAQSGKQIKVITSKPPSIDHQSTTTSQSIELPKVNQELKETKVNEISNQKESPTKSSSNELDSHKIETISNQKNLSISTPIVQIEQNKKSPVALDNDDDDNDEILNRIYNLLVKSEYVHDHLVEKQFAEKYSEKLPTNWFNLVEKSKKFEVIKHESIRLGSKSAQLVAINRNHKMTNAED